MPPSPMPSGRPWPTTACAHPVRRSPRDRLSVLVILVVAILVVPVVFVVRVADVVVRVRFAVRTPAPCPRPGRAAARLRTSAAMRSLVREQALRPADLVLPMFVREGAGENRPISSMPGVVQHTMDSLVRAATEAVERGVGGLMLFGVPEHKDALGSGASDPEGVLNQALARLRFELGDSTVIMADLCLDEFTDHGHCGVLDERGRVD